MKRWIFCILMLLAFGVEIARAEASLGVGYRHFFTVDELEKPFKENGYGGYINWRMQWTEWLGGLLELAFYEDGYAGTSNEPLAPQAFLLLGGPLYLGAGVGILYSKSDFADSPFWVVRAGYEGVLTEWFLFDVTVSYEFSEWNGVNKVDERFESDTVVVGAGLRVLF